MAQDAENKKEDKPESPKKENDSPKKKVLILHQFPRVRWAPSFSPFALKLETFLRLHNVEYENDFKNFRGPLGKAPWITDQDGKEIPDSQLIIEYLMESRNLKMAQLTSEQKAMAMAIRSLLEDHFHWLLVSKINIHGKLEDNLKMFPSMGPAGTPKFVQKLIVKQIMKRVGGQARNQGLGLFSLDEIHKLAVADLEAVSVLLGKKKYLFGDTISSADLTLFGYTSILFFGLAEDNYLRKTAEEKFANLKEFAHRIKTNYWPDWDDILFKDAQPATSETTAADKQKEKKKTSDGESKTEQLAPTAAN